MVWRNATSNEKQKPDHRNLLVFLPDRCRSRDLGILQRSKRTLGSQIFFKIFSRIVVGGWRNYTTHDSGKSGREMYPLTRFRNSLDYHEEMTFRRTNLNSNQLSLADLAFLGFGVPSHADLENVRKSLAPCDVWPLLLAFYYATFHASAEDNIVLALWKVHSSITKAPKRRKSWRKSACFQLLALLLWVFGSDLGNVQKRLAAYEGVMLHTMAEDDIALQVWNACYVT